MVFWDVSEDWRKVPPARALVKRLFFYFYPARAAFGSGVTLEVRTFYVVIFWARMMAKIFN